MGLPFEVHVALRYLLAKRKQAFISVISAISADGANNRNHHVPFATVAVRAQ